VDNVNVITIRVPGSTSNLGPGFDTLGLALRIYVDVDVVPYDGGPWLVAEGEGGESIGPSRENLIHEAYDLVARGEGVTAPEVAFRVRNEIPLARGLGSSAAASVAGVAAFEAVTGREIPTDRLLRYGMQIEGHLDNFGPSLFGGMITACAGPECEPAVVRREWPEELRAVVVIPDVPLKTSEARAILPDAVPRRDAIFNVQRAALFHAALSERRWDLLGEAMRDRLHQPYRERLLPGLREVFALEPDGSLLGVALSGSGSAVLAFATGDFEAVGGRIAGCFSAHGIATSVRVLEGDPYGRRVLSR
jgi:homoserine kinase